MAEVRGLPFLHAARERDRCRTGLRSSQRCALLPRGQIDTSAPRHARSRAARRRHGRGLRCLCANSSMMVVANRTPAWMTARVGYSPLGNTLGAVKGQLAAQDLTVIGDRFRCDYRGSPADPRKCHPQTSLQSFRSRPRPSMSPTSSNVANARTTIHYCLAVIPRP